jgi:glucose-6-phosphate dehydrogenase assembly protein OpcA
MSEDVWVKKDTDPDAIEAALRELLRRRYVADRRLAPARVLNLIVIVDREWKGEIASRLEHVGRYHASRTILCAVEEGRETLDAVATISYDESAAPAHPMYETVEVDLGPDQLARIDTVVDPVLVADLPTMLWSPHGHKDAVGVLLPLIDVILVDSDADFESDDASTPLAYASELLRSAYVVDLAWLRTTPWRERLAASFDPPGRRAALEQLTEVCVRHRPSSEASAALLSGWLASRLGWKVATLEQRSAEGRQAMAARPAGDAEIEITLAPVDQEAPGLVGVTVGWTEGCRLSLDRSAGGLCARQRTSAGDERVWRVLGASRGEGGILGEGVRQALLRDPTYGPALDVARELCGGFDR